jgi:hypothetical protein
MATRLKAKLPASAVAPPQLRWVALTSNLILGFWTVDTVNGMDDRFAAAVFKLDEDKIFDAADGCWDVVVCFGTEMSRVGQSFVSHTAATSRAEEILRGAPADLCLVIW